MSISNTAFGTKAQSHIKYITLDNTTPVLLSSDANGTSDRETFLVKNTDAAITVYIGNTSDITATSTTNSTLDLPATQTFTDADTVSPWYAIAASGAPVVRVWETY